MGRPRAAQHNIMLAVEEVGRVRGIQRHGLEAVVLHQRRACPLPHAAHARLAGERAAPRRHRLRVPATEADVGAGQVDE